MIVLISPAKRLDYESPVAVKDYTQPRFLDDSQALIDELVNYTPKRIGKLMSLSDNLAELNAERYRSFELPFTADTARQSIYAFKGDVYVGLEAETLTKRDINFAQKHLRILSGLYGVLKPLDLIQPYRLEMGADLKNKRGKNLYEFWDTRITESLNEELVTVKSPLIVNLASNEYFKSVKVKQLSGRLVSPVFKDEKNGEYKIISFFAKKARGAMARYIIQNRIKSLKGLTEFNGLGYAYDEQSSTDAEPVFKRAEQVAG